MHAESLLSSVPSQSIWPQPTTASARRPHADTFYSAINTTRNSPKQLEETEAHARRAFRVDKAHSSGVHRVWTALPSRTDRHLDAKRSAYIDDFWARGQTRNKREEDVGERQSCRLAVKQVSPANQRGKVCLVDKKSDNECPEKRGSVAENFDRHRDPSRGAFESAVG